MLSNAAVPMTYEVALEEYNDVLEKDHLSAAYARLFCDYMGIMLAILPVFIAVTRGLRDRRARAGEVIYSRSASSFHIITTRYLAMIIMILLPVILISFIPALECLYYGTSIGIAIDHFAFIKYILGWLLPSIMIATSVGVFLTELTDTAIAIVVQGLWWFISLFMGLMNMMGGYGRNLMPRHNTVGNYSIFKENIEILIANRITYASVAVLLIIASVIVYDLKRWGKLNIHGTIFSNRNSKSTI